jgi:energy-converting hydrogenase A subunit M
MLERFPQELRERLEREGSYRLLLSALLDLAEESLKEEESILEKEGIEEEPLQQGELQEVLP